MKLAKLILLSSVIAIPAMMSAEEHLKSLNAQSIDNSIPASKDFYLHVNKGWMDANPLTPEHAPSGVSVSSSVCSPARRRDTVS